MKPRVQESIVGAVGHALDVGSVDVVKLALQPGARRQRPSCLVDLMATPSPSGLQQGPETRFVFCAREPVPIHVHWHRQMVVECRRSGNLDLLPPWVD